MNEQRRPTKVSPDTPATQRVSGRHDSTDARPAARVDRRQSNSDPAGGAGNNPELRASGDNVPARREAPPAAERTERDGVQKQEGGAIAPVWEQQRLDPTAALILTAPPKDEEIEIRPDGLLYYPHHRVRQRLNRAFGPTGWRMVEVDNPMVGTNEIVQRWRLEVRGGWTATAPGHAAFIRGNARYIYGDALETVKSDALVRCCKDLGVALELWDRRFGEQWKARFAVQVWRTRKNAYEWRRKDADAFYDENKPGRGSESEYARKPDYDDQAKAHLASLKPDPEMPSSRVKPLGRAISTQEADERQWGDLMIQPKPLSREEQTWEPNDDEQMRRLHELEDAVFVDDAREDT